MFMTRRTLSLDSVLSIISELAKLPVLMATISNITNPQTPNAPHVSSITNEELELLMMGVGVMAIAVMVVLFISIKSKPDYGAETKTRGSTTIFTFISSSFQSVTYGYLQSSTSDYGERFKDREFLSRGKFLVLLCIIQAVLFSIFGADSFFENIKREKEAKKIKETKDISADKGRERPEQRLPSQSIVAMLFALLMILTIFILLILMMSIMTGVFASIQAFFGGILCVSILFLALSSLILQFSILTVETGREKKGDVAKQDEAMLYKPDEERGPTAQTMPIKINPTYTTSK